MDASTPGEETDALASPARQLVLELLDADIGAWVLDRLAAGDEVALCADGSWYVGPGRGG